MPKTGATRPPLLSGTRLGGKFGDGGAFGETRRFDDEAAQEWDPLRSGGVNGMRGQFDL